MEGSLARPSVDHFIGQAVEKIVSYGDEDFEWAVKMEGGALFKNHDGRRTALPDESFAGQTLSASIFNEVDTRLVFGNGEEITFTPTLYSIAPSKGASEFFPHMPDEEELVPVEFPAELEERMPDGPTMETKAPKKGGRSAKKKS